MRLQLRMLISRLRRTATLTALRLVGLSLAAVLAASVPTFVATSMEQVLHQQLKTVADPLTVVASWAAPDEEDYGAKVAALDQFLRSSFVQEAGFPAGSAETATLVASRQRAVQRLVDGKLQAGKRYLKLAVQPEGLQVASGRLPAAGKAEVALPDGAPEKMGYEIGAKLRVPLTDQSGGETVEVTLVGTFKAPAEGAASHLSGALGSALVTSREYWESLKLPTGEQTWAIQLPEAHLHAAGVAQLGVALQEVPLRLVQFLPDAEVSTTPQAWIADFARQMEATVRFLLVLLTPVFLLVLFLVVATANVVIDSRRTEIAVLRSRGMTPLRVIAFYLPESLALAGAAVLAGLLLTSPLVRVMGLTSGFLKLVSRPAIPVALGWNAVAYAAAAALIAEVASLVPLSRAARFTVATIKQEAATRSVVLEAVRVMLELLLLAVLGYGTWKLRGEGATGDPLYLALPSLALAGAGVVSLRLFEFLLHWADRFLRPVLPPALYLAVSLLRNQAARYRTLSLMLVITSGLGIYGASFARTLDRDLVARSTYSMGADLSLRAVWESEVTSIAADGSSAEVAYREPPYDPFKNLPGATGIARVQTRKAISFTAGNRSLGKAELVGIEPKEFGQTARFLTELTPNPAGLLTALASDERAVLVSASMAKRLGLKVGDQIKAKLDSSEAPMVVAGIVSYWPGRLPEEGDFVVGHLAYVQDLLGLAPYDVWVRLDAGASAVPLADALKERAVRIASYEDARSLVATGRKQPFRMGIYATLSAGFVVAVFVMALTYLLSVGLTLQSRAKELGVLRAMGMPQRSVALSLYTEQLVMMGMAAATGLLAGAQAAALYVPILRQQPGETLLPLRVADVASERLWLAAAFALALGTGAATVAVWLKRLNLNAVLRLGEDG